MSEGLLNQADRRPSIDRVARVRVADATADGIQEIEGNLPRGAELII